MAALALMAEAHAKGVTLRLEDGKVRAIGPEDVVDGLLPRLRAEREELLAVLAGGMIKDRHARLCRLLDEVVETKFGRGRLWQVFAHRVAVVIQPGHLTFMQPEDVFLEP